MSRRASNLVLLLVGLALTTLAVRGTSRWYVVPGMRWPVLAAGCVILLLFVADVVADARSGHQGRDDEHDHDHGPGLVSWLLPLPALLLLFVGPTPVAAQNAGGGLAGSGISAAREPERSRDYPALPDVAAPEIGFLDLSRRAVFDRARSLDGREVTVTGTVLRDDDGVRLGRVAIICCAADARTVAVRVADPRSVHLLDVIPTGGWAKVVLTVVPDSATREHRYVPAAEVRTVRPVPVPENSYEVPGR